MKSIHPLMGVFCLSVLLALVLPVSSVPAGVLHFKMTAPKTTLAVGEEVTVTVSAWVDDPIAEPDNGLSSWQVDLSVVENTGIIGITTTGSVADITLLMPWGLDPSYAPWDSTSVNSPITGEARKVRAVPLIYPNSSYIGVSGYTDIFTFNIKALAHGTATYTICDDGGGLFFGWLVDLTEYDNNITPGSVVFDASSSDRTFTVVPEPMSLALFVLAGSLAAIRKK